MMRNLAVFLLVMALFTACKKQEVLTIQAPSTQPDTLIPRVKMEAYVSRLYIDLLGRKPNSQELSSAADNLQKSNADFGSRQALFGQIAAQPDFIQHLYLNAKQDYLNGVEDAEIKNDLASDSFQIKFAIALGDIGAQYYWEVTYALRDSILAIPADLQSGKITYRQMLRRIILNPYYDEINMGVANFSFAVFESFLFRAPTTEEWQKAQDMCNGSLSTILGKNGSNKADFTDICLSSNNFYEGQVNTCFSRYLKRRPSSAEMDAYTKIYYQSDSIKDLIESIVTTSDYFNL